MRDTEAYGRVSRGDRIRARFSVGVAHPLYGKEVDAIVDATGTGYDGRRIHAHTVTPVHYPEDPTGIFVYDKNGNFVRNEPRAAFDQTWSGYVEAVRIRKRNNRR